MGSAAEAILGLRNRVPVRGAAPALGIPAPAGPRSAEPPQVALRHFGASLVCPGDFFGFPQGQQNPKQRLSRTGSSEIWGFASDGIRPLPLPLWQLFLRWDEGSDRDRDRGWDRDWNQGWGRDRGWDQGSDRGWGGFVLLLPHSPFPSCSSQLLLRSLLSPESSCSPRDGGAGAALSPLPSPSIPTSPVSSALKIPQLRAGSVGAPSGAGPAGGDGAEPGPAGPGAVLASLTARSSPCPSQACSTPTAATPFWGENPRFPLRDVSSRFPEAPGGGSPGPARQRRAPALCSGNPGGPEPSSRPLPLPPGPVPSWIHPWNRGDRLGEHGERDRLLGFGVYGFCRNCDLEQTGPQDRELPLPPSSSSLLSPQTPQDWAGVEEPVPVCPQTRL